MKPLPSAALHAFDQRAGHQATGQEDPVVGIDRGPDLLAHEDHECPALLDKVLDCVRLLFRKLADAAQDDRLVVRKELVAPVGFAHQVTCEEAVVTRAAGRRLIFGGRRKGHLEVRPGLVQRLAAARSFDIDDQHLELIGHVDDAIPAVVRRQRIAAAIFAAADRHFHHMRTGTMKIGRPQRHQHRIAAWIGFYLDRASLIHGDAVQ